MKIHRNISQGSVEWGMLRAGKVTASEMDRLVSPTGKIRTGEGPNTYLMQKVAEAWTGSPLPSAAFWDGDQGQFLEEIARPAFTLETGLEVEEVGFIESDDGRVGCSPDGFIVGLECGLEIKCPHLDKHIGYLLGGKVPDDYIMQVQAALYVTGYPMWKFFSYRRGLPPLMLTVEPQPAIQETIAEAVNAFALKMESALARLTELYGGVRPEPFKLTPKLQQEDEPYVDVIP